MYDMIFPVFAGVSALLAAYYVFLIAATRPVRENGSGPEEQAEGISVITVGRNAIDNLRSLIPSVIAQKYPRFELIVVDDRSFDNTAVFLKSIQRNYPSVLKVVTIPEDTTYPWPGKKFAVTMGVKAAQYERIVLLDTSALPLSENWLSNVASAFDRKGTDMVLGYNFYKKGQRAVSSFFAAASFLFSSDAMAWARIGLPFKGEGSNFGFTRTMFFSGSGYMNNMRIPAGEADFLLGDYSDGTNVSVMASRQGFVQCGSVDTIRQWLDKAISDYASFRCYKFPVMLRALAMPLLKVLFIVLAITCGVIYCSWWPFWVVTAVPMALSFAAGFVCSDRFRATRWMASGILADMVLLPVNAAVWFSAMFAIPGKWK